MERDRDDRARKEIYGKLRVRIDNGRKITLKKNRLRNIMQPGVRFITFTFNFPPRLISIRLKIYFFTEPSSESAANLFSTSEGTRNWIIQCYASHFLLLIPYSGVIGRKSPWRISLALSPLRSPPRGQWCPQPPDRNFLDLTKFLILLPSLVDVL